VGLWKTAEGLQDAAGKGITVAMLAHAQILAGRRGLDDRLTRGKPATIPHPHPQVRSR
jgi:hypothetical protein